MEIFASTGQEIRNLLLKKVDGKRKTLTLLNQWDKISEENGATLQSDNIICLGDLNCDGNPLDNYNKGRCLLDVCDIYDLDLLNSPRRISSLRSSCLDVILANVPGYFREPGTLEVGLSDHCLVYTIFNKKLSQPKAEIIRVRSFKNFDEGSFCSNLGLVPFSTTYVFGP